MTIAKGNTYYKEGLYVEAIKEYSKISLQSPFFKHAQLNIKLAKKRLSGDLNSSIDFDLFKPVDLARMNLAKLPALKGVASDDCLRFDLHNPIYNYYYKVTFYCDEAFDGVVTVRDSDTNRSIYQSQYSDILNDAHVFLIPPSLKNKVSISIHPSKENAKKLEIFKNNTFLNVEIISHIDDKLFRPSNINNEIVASFATIQDRLDIALDAAYSLLGQVDRVRIHINDMTEIPSELRHPRIIVTTYADAGDLGDSGKFLGLQKEQKYQTEFLVCDDDFIYPYNFIIKMSDDFYSKGKRAVIGMHGVYLRYPMLDYYAGNARNTMHCTTGFNMPTTVGVVGTGVIYFSNDILDVRNFQLDYKNMADIWFALECDKHNLPIYIGPRYTNWLIDNPPTSNSNSIYSHATGNVVSEANTRVMQSYVLSNSKKYIFSKKMQGDNFRRYILALDYNTFLNSIEVIENISKTEMSPALVCVYDCNEIEQAKVKARSIYADIVFSYKKNTVEQVDTYLKNADFYIDIDNVGIILLDRIKKLLSMPELYNGEISTEFNTCIPISNSIANVFYKHSFALSTNSWSNKCDGRISSRISDAFFQTFKVVSDPAVDFFRKKQGVFKLPTNKIKKFSTYFDAFYVLNLDSRPDRLKDFSSRAKKWGIEFERVSAVNGKSEAIIPTYPVVQQRLIDSFAKNGKVFKYESSLYFDYQSESERIAHFLLKNGKTFSAGGYGYLLTYKKILESAISNNHKRIVVFDDDCMFHKNLDDLFSDFINGLPDDWVTLSLGTLQYDWREKYINWERHNAYRCNGFSVGSHAQAYSNVAFPMLLENINSLTLPFDVGALHKLKRFYSTKSFTAFPNLFIQDVSDTDIGDSAVQLSEGIKNDNIYKWTLSDYE